MIANGNTQSIPYDTTGGFEPIQIIDETSFVFQGCATGYAFNPISSSTQVEKLAIIPNNANPLNGYESEIDIDQGFTDYVYIPIKVGGNTKKLVTYLAPLTEQRYQNPHTYWKIDAKSTINFDVTENSGYKMFVNWVSESPDEKYDISMDIDDVSFSAYPSDRDESGDGSPDSDPKKLTRTSTYSPNSLEIDFRVPSGVSNISLNFDTKEWTRLKSEDFNGNRPLTPRILSVSGCLLPINVETITNTVVKERKIYITTCSGVPWYIPEETIQRPSEFRPIKTLNNKYCGPDACEGYDNKLIEDGPVFTRYQADSRVRPLALLRFNTCLPALVAMRERNPWVLLRLMTLGWKVLFIIFPEKVALRKSGYSSVSSFRQCSAVLYSLRMSPKKGMRILMGFPA